MYDPNTKSGWQGTLFSSLYFRIFLILCGFAIIVLYRRSVASFGVSLGYLYVLLIVLSGLWFGIKGGVGAALLAMTIHLVEVAAYLDFPHRDVVTQGAYFRFFAYVIGGLTIGYFSGSEKKLKEKLYQMAHYDELTECTNYRYTLELLEHEIARAKRYQKQVALVIIDMDHFKKVNDTYGHVVGNEVLEVFAKTLRSNLREIDVAGRYGGDEFLLILPETNAQQAQSVLERIREKLLQITPAALKGKGPATLAVQFSAGIASLPQHANNMNDLLEAADDALYQAKREGRNRIFVERRKERRQKPPDGLRIELRAGTEKEKTIFPRIVNFSCLGMLASLSKDISQEDLFCRLSHADGQFSSECRCNVVYKHKTGEHTYHFGTSFVGIPVDIQNKLKYQP